MCKLVIHTLVRINSINLLAFSYLGKQLPSKNKDTDWRRRSGEFGDWQLQESTSNSVKTLFIKIDICFKPRLVKHCCELLL